MGNVFKFKPRFNIKELFGKGIGSVIDKVPASMQLPLLKFMKKVHPVYADRLIYDMANSYWTRDSIYNKMGVKKNKAERELSKWIFANVDHAAGRENVSIGWPKLLDFTIREGNRKKPPNFIRAFDEDFLKYKETDEFKYDMALQDQIREKEAKLKLEEEIDNILEFKKPEKNMGGLISLIS
mgnify:CR=1 FL=1|tara:strand:+ start:765 stop:1310 length:546 start_codon:yes stop_codon:yes gene_type:complete